MGSGMSKILPGLYVGNFRDAKDVEKLKENNVTHILSIHDNAKKILQDKEYLIILASDSPYQDLTQYFPQCVDFIHKARLSGGGCIVHCLAGVSRSVTVTAAYLMTVTNLGWRDALNAIRGARNVANPNFGFQKQLQQYENDHLEKARKAFKEQYPDSHFHDEEDCQHLLRSFKHFVLTGESPSSPSLASAPKDERDGLYPLPHGAYSSKRGSKLNPDSLASTSQSPNCSSSASISAPLSASSTKTDSEDHSSNAEGTVSDGQVSEPLSPKSLSAN